MLPDVATELKGSKQLNILSLSELDKIIFLPQMKFLCICLYAPIEYHILMVSIVVSSLVVLLLFLASSPMKNNIGNMKVEGGRDT